MMIGALWGSPRLETSPAYWVLLNQRQAQIDDSTETTGQINTWMAFLPFLQSATVFPGTYFQGETSDMSQRRFGFSIEAAEARNLGIPQTRDTLVFPAQTCLHTVVRMSRPDDHITFAFLEETLAHIRKEGWLLSGNVLGNCIVKVHEEHCNIDAKPKELYYELWIPVHQQEARR